MRGSRRRARFTLVAYFATYIIFYLLLSSKTTTVEAVAALAVATGVLTLTARVRSRVKTRFRFRAKWVLVIARKVPTKAILDCGRVFLALWRYMRLREPIEGHIASMPFQAGGDDPESAARRALVLILISLTPNTVSIGVDRKQGRLLVHQLVPTNKKPDSRQVEWPI